MEVVIIQQYFIYKYARISRVKSVLSRQEDKGSDPPG